MRAIGVFGMLMVVMVVGGLVVVRGAVLAGVSGVVCAVASERGGVWGSL